MQAGVYRTCLEIGFTLRRLEETVGSVVGLVGGALVDWPCLLCVILGVTY